MHQERRIHKGQDYPSYHSAAQIIRYQLVCAKWFGEFSFVQVGYWNLDQRTAHECSFTNWSTKPLINR